MRVSYAAGRWEHIQRTRTSLPYLAYSAVLDLRTRHTANGTASIIPSLRSSTMSTSRISQSRE